MSSAAIWPREGSRRSRSAAVCCSPGCRPAGSSVSTRCPASQRAGASRTGSLGSRSAVAERRELAARPAQRTLRFNRPDDGDFTLDPAIAYSPVGFQREFATCATLVTYQDRAGQAGLQIVPELARSLPAVSSNGLTYTFHVRDDMWFSPPSNAPVTAADVKATIERALGPTWPDGPSPGAFFLRDIAGARDYLAGKAGEISGIAVSGDRLTFRLARPVPDLLHRLALPFFCVLPKGAPIVARRTQRPDPDRRSVLPCIGAYRLRPAHHCAAPQSELPR